MSCTIHSFIDDWMRVERHPPFSGSVLKLTLSKNNNNIQSKSFNNMKLTNVNNFHPNNNQTKTRHYRISVGRKCIASRLPKKKNLSNRVFFLAVVFFFFLNRKAACRKLKMERERFIESHALRFA